MTTDTNAVTELARLLKVIADETRLRILGALAEQPQTGKDLAARLQLTPATISHHMRKLTDAHVVIAVSDAQRQRYSLNGDLLRSSRSTPIDPPRADVQPAPGDSEETAFRAKVLRNFFDGSTLRQIPAQRKQRVVVLQHLMEQFDPARQYPEREVNDILRAAHEDFATLRRELVDYGYLERDRGFYQVTRGAPARGATVGQEITGNEQEWLNGLLTGVVAASRR